VSGGRCASGRGAQKGRGRAEVAGDRAVVGASTAGERGREFGDEMTGGVGETKREAGARARETAPTSLAHWAAGGREGEKGRDNWRRQAGPTCQAPRARGQGRGRAREARLAGPTGLKWFFSISREFLMPCPFIFSRVFNSNSNQVSNSNQIKHVEQFKEYLELNIMQHLMTHLFCQKIK
jgi:hypothetical protein